MKKIESTYLRFLIRKDLPEVLAIEKDCFGELAWDKEMFIDRMRNATTIGLVCEVNDDTVAGYVLYQLHAKELRIINLGVCINHRCMGVGRTIIEKLIQKLAYQRRNMVRCIVSESNLDAHLFFRSMGFECAGVIRRPFMDLDEDGYEFRYVVGQPICDTRWSESEVEEQGAENEDKVGAPNSLLK